MLPYEACTLGSINVSKFVRVIETTVELNWSALAETVKLAVRFLDNILDVCNYPVRDTVHLAQSNRKIGLGLMGFADCLFTLGIPYDSKRGVEFGTELMKFLNDKAHEASAELANLRGPFPNWQRSLWKKRKIPEIRNASVTCIAPTGTISIISDCSSGIEPVYSLVFLRQVLDGKKLLQIDPVFKRITVQRGIYNKKLERQIARIGSIQKMSEIPSDIRRIFRGAYDIKPQWHIRMQAAFQTSHAVTVTITRMRL